MAYNQKQKESTIKYLKTLKEIRFRVKEEEYVKYEEAAKQAGYPSMRKFYMDAIQEKVGKILKQPLKPLAYSALYSIIKTVKKGKA